MMIICIPGLIMFGCKKDSEVTYTYTIVPLTMLGFSNAPTAVLNQSFVRQLGYELSPGQEEINNQEYFLTREKFGQMAPRIRKAIHALANDISPGRFVVEPVDFNNDVVLFFEELAKKNFTFLKTEVTEEGRIYFVS